MTKLKAYKVTLLNVTGGAPREVAKKVFADGPGDSDASLLDHNYGTGPNDWTRRIRVRQKTLDGDVKVIARCNGNTQELPAGLDTPARFLHADGNEFEVRVELLPKTQWKDAPSIAFASPKATIVGQNGGWLVTFEPQQYPCVLTIAVEAQRTKDENLPSFPFPSNPRYPRGSFFLAPGQFDAAEGGLVRLGIRGAGREVRVALPKQGETKQVEPKHFKVAGPAQPERLTEQYVLTKFNEKKSLIRYG